MTPQSPQDGTIEAALDKFTTDATSWDGVSATLGEAAAAARALTLQGPDFGLTFSVANAYADVQNLVATVLQAGSDECTAVGKALRIARDTYEREEAENIHRIRGIW